MVYRDYFVLWINFSYLSIVVSAKEFLDQQSREFQKHVETRNELERTLQYHRNIKTHRTIPRKFRPSDTPKTVRHSITLTDDFTQKYENLFFEHLDKVITNNQITLELTKAAMESILTQTETYLSSIEASPLTVTDLYHQFLYSFQSRDRQPLPGCNSWLVIAGH